MRYLLTTVIIVYVLWRLFLFFADLIASKIGLFKLIIMQRYLDNKITDSEMQDYERDHNG